jgi:hypothetical protein
MNPPRRPGPSSHRRAVPFSRRSTRSASDPDPSDDDGGNTTKGLQAKVQELSRELEEKSNDVLGLKRNLANLSMVAKGKSFDSATSDRRNMICSKPTDEL